MGFTLQIPPSVFHPKFYFSSVFFGKHILTIDLEGKKLLEMGCGSGIICLISASKGAFVTGIDINPEAVTASRENAIRNHLNTSITVYHGDLFAPLTPNLKFDFILFNPPFYTGIAVDQSELAWKGGKDHSIIKQFIHLSRDYLNDNGKILIVLSSDMNISSILESFRENQFALMCVASKQTLFDELYIYQAQPCS